MFSSVPKNDMVESSRDDKYIELGTLLTICSLKVLGGGGVGGGEGEIVRRVMERKAMRMKRIRVTSWGVMEAPGEAKRDFIVEG